MKRRITSFGTLTVALALLAGLAAGDGVGTTYTETGGTNGIAVGIDGRGIAVADLNADGYPDLIVGRRSEPARILLGNGTGSFVNSGISLGTTNADGVYVVDYDSDCAPRRNAVRLSA